ncbi:serine hydrolase domain-containing protein [Aquimarina litoralis]|uniref:serine hydrolase domain-containing protein n=1 Tax=Aquimarina litoralis TaxID=584605 RepID=UPI001C5A2BCC|nr:serine hydrolase domain-containing protein [Aquimarina litoralis]MBW1296628.1 serine hydrolase [Aquimarina litoralis]
MNLSKNILFFALLISLYVQSQSLTTQQNKYIDSLTAHWNQPIHPGGAIAFIQNGKTILQKVAGTANIDKQQPITEETSFQLAQLSDSFIAFALIQLHQEKKLSLDNKLSLYFPDFKKFKQKLTIKNLLQQSSGIHDFEILKNIAGWRDTDHFSKEDALHLIRNQQSLSFIPGTEFSYSRSNMLLASMLIEKASKMPFEKYMEEQVFTPLGMKNTFVINAANQNTKNLAQSYRIQDNDITLIPSLKETYAGINIASSLSDMILWEKNLASPNSKTQEIVTLFSSFVQLNNGLEYKAPRGTLMYGQRYVHKERGLETIMSTGGIDGYASTIFNFPTEKFTAIVLSNNGEPYNGYIGMLSAHSILGNKFTEPFSIDFSTIRSIPIDQNYHRQFEGFYWDAIGEISREIRIENDTLRYIRPNQSTALIPISKNKFQMKTDFDDKIFLTFSKDAKNKVSMSFAFGDATPFEFIKYTPKTLTQKDLQSKYSGEYYCKEIGIGYHFEAKDNKLISSNVKSDTMTFSPIKQEIFSGDQWYMQSIEFRVNSEGIVEGFYVRNDAIRNLWFEKIKNHK